MQEKLAYASTYAVNAVSSRKIHNGWHNGQNTSMEAVSILALRCCIRCVGWKL